MILDCQNAKTRRDLEIMTRHTVFLDGLELKDCWYADDERGIVKVYRRGVGGLDSVTLHGKVEIRRIDFSLETLGRRECPECAKLGHPCEDCQV